MFISQSRKQLDLEKWAGNEFEFWWQNCCGCRSTQKILIKRRGKKNLTLPLHPLYAFLTWHHLCFKGCPALPLPPPSSASHNPFTVIDTGREREYRRRSDEMAAAAGLPQSNQADEEDYIDMEVSSSSSSNVFLYSPPQSREFEFQMSCSSNGRESTTSPADELFYKGKLLPLHLPPRLQMVQKLLQNPPKESFGDESYTISFITNSATPSTNTSTPLESCTISPTESCRVSSELNPDEYFFEWSAELSAFIADNNPKKSWSKKLKLVKQSLLYQKLKASRAYLKSLFSKSACSDESSTKAASSEEAGNDSKVKDSFNKYVRVAKRAPFGQIGRGTYPTLAAIMKSIDSEAAGDCVSSSHRKSFSGAIKRHSATKSLSSSSSSASSLSSSFSTNSSGFYDLQLLKRSSSAISEIESSIEGAIAHCKQS
ncbi:probable membrane-associated kinase regulator 4 [Diospyros lotus]|uniref:probable membrane-associated kinase regulator 4 n=1 Tax=Diospyros lotus TaxID=55363 RepID=UPI00224D0416|nr:probable membrane-associated kinase regulator 4 [Diospyros lotus]